MTTLDYPGQPPRVTDDAEIVATLTRKGWTVRADPPAYDPQTQQITWDGSKWVVGPIPPKATPDSVPAHKWRMALRAGGFRAAYETHVTAASANAQDYWKTAPYINRRSKFMGALRTALGITQRQMDAVFEAADTEED